MKRFFHIAAQMLRLIPDILINKRRAYETVLDMLESLANLKTCSKHISIGTIEYLQSQSSPDKPVLILLHGMGSDKESLLPFAQQLQTDFELLIPDLPGHGKSVQQIDLDYSVAHQVAWLNEWLEALAMEYIHLVGHSMGGAIATQYAYQYPQKVETLTLISAHGALSTPSKAYKLYHSTGDMPMLEVNTLADYHAMLKLAMEHPPYIPGFVQENLVQNMRVRHKLNRKIFNDASRDLDQSKILTEICVPSLIVWGAEDQVLHVDDAERYHQGLLQSQKVILPGVGHVPIVEKPKAVAKHLEAFIATYRV